MFYRKIEASAQAPTQIILIRLLKSLDFRLVELDYYTDPIQCVNIYFLTSYLVIRPSQPSPKSSFPGRADYYIYISRSVKPQFAMQ